MQIRKQLARKIKGVASAGAHHEGLVAALAEIEAEIEAELQIRDSRRRAVVARSISVCEDADNEVRGALQHVDETIRQITSEEEGRVRTLQASQACARRNTALKSHFAQH